MLQALPSRDPQSRWKGGLGLLSTAVGIVTAAGKETELMSPRETGWCGGRGCRFAVYGRSVKLAFGVNLSLVRNDGHVYGNPSRH